MVSHSDHSVNRFCTWWCSVDVSGSRSLRSYFGGVVAMHGIGPNLAPACTARLDATSVRACYCHPIFFFFSFGFLAPIFFHVSEFPLLHTFMQCFFPQNVIDGTKTPIFLLNAAYDFIQVRACMYAIDLCKVPNHTGRCRVIVTSCSHLATNAFYRSDRDERGSKQR
jgi:hypothetical protein